MYIHVYMYTCIHVMGIQIGEYCFLNLYHFPHHRCNPSWVSVMVPYESVYKTLFIYLFICLFIRHRNVKPIACDWSVSCSDPDSNRKCKQRF